jgi:alcohol dehydrogenase (cytochrome c)/quinohemoprotein ethanol dehydrogenase
MVLAELEIDGAERKVIMQVPKNGFYYVIDRATGELISAKNIVPTNWATHIDMETGRPVETADARYDETLAAKIMAPGPGGAHNWQPMSYHPGTGLVYIPAKQEPFAFKLDEDYEPGPIGMNLGVDFWSPPGEVIPLAPEFGEFHQGFLLAWNPVTQEEAWRVPHSNFENGGVLSTAGNLVFQGTADGEMVAYNAESGERVWSAPTQTGVLAPPITYSVDGEQYIAVVAGWGAVSTNFTGLVLNADGTKRNISRILAFKVGGGAELPPMPDMPARIAPPDQFGSAEQVAKGGGLYMRYCAVCHGVAAIAGGAIPDLRHTAMTASTTAFNTIVLEGALLDNGMASFSEVLSEADAEAVRAYIVMEANK